MSTKTEGERIDDLHRRGYHIIQNPQRFCFGMDAVLLSGFTRVREGENVLDLGCGNGIIPILLEAKTPGRHFTGLELFADHVDMARRSVAMNGQQEKITILEGDIRRADQLFAPASFDVVTSNPPYMTSAHGLLNPDPEKAAARHELFCTMEDVVRAASRLVKVGGSFFLVHRPFRLAELIRTLSAWNLEPKRMRLVYPYVDREPNMVLMEAVRGGKPRLAVEPPFIVYERPGVYTKELLQWYYEPETETAY